jgi:hypothetical protein
MLKRVLSISVFAGLLLMPVVPYAGVVNVFLDDGVHVAGSSNSGMPFTNGDRDVSWDVTATAESGLASVGAAVMTVRLVTFNTNGDSRSANTAAGNGLAVDTGTNNEWFDGGTREAALFQFSFYSDLAKTTEISGLDIGLLSIVSRVQNGTTKMVDAYVGSGALTFSNATIDNTTDIFLGGSLLNTGRDPANSFDSALGFQSSSDTLTYYTMTAAVGSIDSFDEDDSLWIRRRNTTVGDSAYQLGAISLNVIPEPTTLGLCGFVAAGMFLIRRFRMS